mmetsp:Transcript_66432/g.183910  ORF Transcript_66432/g.183910 Transcript_66432/m.183910 type:complete len:203 (+) Transcript_66432:400-1008(+)
MAGLTDEHPAGERPVSSARAQRGEARTRVRHAGPGESRPGRRGHCAGLVAGQAPRPCAARRWQHGPRCGVAAGGREQRQGAIRGFPRGWARQGARRRSGGRFQNLDCSEQSDVLPELRGGAAASWTHHEVPFFIFLIPLLPWPCPVSHMVCYGQKMAARAAHRRVCHQGGCSHATGGRQNISLPFFTLDGVMICRRGAAYRG